MPFVGYVSSQDVAVAMHLDKCFWMQFCTQISDSCAVNMLKCVLAVSKVIHIVIREGVGDDF